MDIVYVAYNSEKWIDKCFTSLLSSQIDLKEINVYVVDNNSSDNTVQALHNVKHKLGNSLGKFEIVESNKDNSTIKYPLDSIKIVKEDIFNYITEI